ARWMPRGLEYGAMGALVGVTLSELAALIVVAAVYFVRRREFLPANAVNRGAGRGRVIGPMLAIAIPVTIGAAIMPITGIVDAAMIKSTLMEIGFTEAEASMRYVALRSNVTNIINMPAVLTTALAMSLVPAISAARTAGDKRGVRRASRMGVKLAMFIGLPCAVGLFVLAAPAIDLLYDIDAERLEIAAALMRSSAIGVVFLSLVQTLTGILQGAGKQNVPVINLIIGGVVKVALMLVLMSNPAIEIQGAAIGTVACYAVAGLLDLICLIRFTRLKINWIDTIVKPLGAALLMGAAAYFSYQFFFRLLDSNTAATLAAILVGMVIYLAILIAFKMFSYEDGQFLPGRGRLAKILCRGGQHG
ncbi:MAG: polysaccharide biosynthesis C-terminal domain-containing protein, partial [Clostridia bacterium]|nr:polysaccharide biosynthesis C-terminal domain-containing protein [Clostridia bacterium]